MCSYWISLLNNHSTLAYTLSEFRGDYIYVREKQLFTVISYLTDQHFAMSWTKMLFPGRKKNLCCGTHPGLSFSCDDTGLGKV